MALARSPLLCGPSRHDAHKHFQSSPKSTAAAVLKMRGMPAHAAEAEKAPLKVAARAFPFSSAAVSVGWSVRPHPPPRLWPLGHVDGGQEEVLRGQTDIRDLDPRLKVVRVEAARARERKIQCCVRGGDAQPTHRKKKAVTGEIPIAAGVLRAQQATERRLVRALGAAERGRPRPGEKAGEAAATVSPTVE